MHAGSVGDLVAVLALYVVAALAAAVVGWRALRAQPAARPGVVAAYAILSVPILTTVLYHREGLDFAFELAFVTVLWPIVVAALTAVIVYRRERGRYRVNRYRRTATRHQLADRAVLEHGRDRIRRATAAPAAGEADVTEAAFKRELVLGEYAVALGDSPEAARDHLMAAARLGVSRLPQADLGSYLAIMFCVIAFGTEAERAEVGRGWALRRQDRREPRHLTVFGEGIATLILQRPREARSQLLAVAVSDTRLVFAAIAAAGVALLDRDQSLFERHIVNALYEYRNDYRRFPEDPAGAMNVFALALCRLAIETGFQPAERAYLPLTLLPKASQR